MYKCVVMSSGNPMVISSFMVPLATVKAITPFKFVYCFSYFIKNLASHDPSLSICDPILG